MLRSVEQVFGVGSLHHHCCQHAEEMKLVEAQLADLRQKQEALQRKIADADVAKV